MNSREQFQEETERFFSEALKNEVLPDPGGIRLKVRAAILSKITTQVARLLLGDQEEIFAAYRKAIIAHEGEGKFLFPLSIKAGIEPTGSMSYDIPTVCSFTLKHRTSIKGSIGDDGGTDDMFGENGVESVTLSSKGPGTAPRSVTLTADTAKKAAEILKKSARRAGATLDMMPEENEEE